MPGDGPPAPAYGGPRRIEPHSNAFSSDLCALLARAFVEDPVARYLFPVAARREDGMRRFFAFQLRRSYLPNGEVWVTGEPVVAAALWLPPAALVPRPGDAFWPLLLVGVFGVQLGAARRLGRLLAGRHPSEPHWYLGTIGVEPTHQRRGLGGALLAPVLRRCDDEEVAAYLECSRQENLGFYQRLGFDVIEEVRPSEGPPLWLMWRPPRPADGPFVPLSVEV